jgi:hypothetical protein
MKITEVYFVIVINNKEHFKKTLIFYLIVGLNVALKGPFPLVGESELSRESEMSLFGLF